MVQAKAEKSCYITALNAVYARFATEPVDHANELNRMHFREPVCESASLEERDALALTIQDLLGAFILLGAVTLYDAGQYPRHHRHHHRLSFETVVNRVI